MSQKGSNFEREVCRLLSDWWTNGENDSVFWRTSQSGGRATVRFRKGKLTRGQCGDVAAIDPVGIPLTSVFTIELKRGYNNCDPIHLLDRSPHMARQGFESFLEQVVLASRREGTPYWLIIHKRDQRVPMCYFPRAFASECGTSFDYGATFRLRHRLVPGEKKEWLVFHATPLSKFLDFYDPSDIIRIWSKKK